MKLLGVEIRRVHPEPVAAPMSPKESFIAAARMMTEAWAACREQGLRFSPWIDFKGKEVFVAEPTSNRQRVK